MKLPSRLVAVLGAVLLWRLAGMESATGAVKPDGAPPPHTPTLVFYLTGATGQKDAEAIQTSVQKLRSAAVLEVNTNRGYARVRFDSHIVSYHQVAQALADAGRAADKTYDPAVVFCVSGYARSNNAARVDAIFAGKRLNTRVTVQPLDPAGGKFLIHFLPLKIATNDPAPQGFNGGHLHHPVSDPPPRGLGLPSAYAAEDDPAVPAGRKQTRPPNAINPPASP